MLLSRMDASSVPGQPGARSEHGFVPADDALKVVMVYQDSLTRAWALDLWQRVSSSLKNETFSVQSWRIDDLTHARVMPDTIHSAAKADILLVSVRAAEELPPELSVWVEGWISRRGILAGTLVALMGTVSEPPVEGLAAQQYLEAVARRAKLDFMPRQRALPPGLPPIVSPKQMGTSPVTTAKVPTQIPVERQGLKPK